MKTTILTQEEFDMIMYRAGGALRFKDSGPTHAVLTYRREMPSQHCGYKNVKDIGRCYKIHHYGGFVQDVYEAYIK